MLTDQTVLNALRNVMDPDLHQDLVSLDMIKDVKVDGDQVSFTIELTTPSCPLKSKIENDARQAVLSMTEAKEVDINMSARVRNPKAVTIDKNQFKHVIAVGSGKGGVGKSTVSVNLALALARDGAKVGLLDADIYGPNIPRMLGIDRLPDKESEGKIPVADVFGMKVLSIGFLVQNGQPLIWRGPMLHSAIQQFITDFDWGELDYFVVDLPPGTGDVQLSLSQTLPLTGAVIVTTPQQVAIDDASRAVAMFEKLEVPVLGIVENMSYLLMPDGSKLAVFGTGGGEHLAFRTGTTFLGRIPLDPEIGQGGDTGSPVVLMPDGNPSAEAFREIACRVAAEASIKAHEREALG
ncbi:MAG TPA: Mrp/NBP35 family ATP-binding protein [Anaerolineaceae bacterium]|nr:Mrp/NBP35 family ATP-binding protein [Anaerolineaceae bacterium]